MSIFLPDGGALFLGANWRLTHQSISNDEQCIYDFPIVCFSLDIRHSRIAILTKPDEDVLAAPREKGSAAKGGRNSKRNMSVKGDYTLRVFGFDLEAYEVCDLKGSMTLCEARQIVWSAFGSALLTFDTPSGRVTIIGVSVDPSDCHKLRLREIASDTGTSPLFYGPLDWCGLFNDRRQTMDLWDLKVNKVVQSLQLSRRNIRALDTCTTGSMFITVYDDMSLSFAYWSEAEKKFVKLPKFDGLFPLEEDNAKVNKMATRVRVTVQNKANGITTMVVALSSSRHVYRFEAADDGASCRLVGHSCVSLGDVIVAVDRSGSTALCECERLRFVRRTLVFESRNDPQPAKRAEKAKKKPSESVADSSTSPEAGAVASEAEQPKPICVTTTSADPVPHVSPPTTPENGNYYPSVRLWIAAAVGVLGLGLCLFNASRSRVKLQTSKGRR